MQATIQEQLDQLERDRNIRILLAVESGSRAWGFPSPDSDYDVRVIYVQPSERYLSIHNIKDNFDFFHGELLDINGWDIRKTLSLLAKSNATPFEWAQSPVIYREKPGFKEQLLAFARTYFRPDYALNHYRGIALNSYQRNPLDGAIKLKKLFYVLRPVLAANWIIENQTVPPMQIQPLLEQCDQPEIREEIEQLIQRKATADEAYMHHPSTTIIIFVEESLAILKGTKLPLSPRVDTTELDEFFRTLISYDY